MIPILIKIICVPLRFSWSQNKDRYYAGEVKKLCPFLLLENGRGKSETIRYLPPNFFLLSARRVSE